MKTNMLFLLVVVCVVAWCGGCGGSVSAGEPGNTVSISSRPESESVIPNDSSPHNDDDDNNDDSNDDSNDDDSDNDFVDDEYHGPPMELVEDNMNTTAFSGVVRIEAVNVSGPGGGPVDGSGYVNHEYSVTVLETMVDGAQGVNGAHARIMFSVMADADSTPWPVQDVLFVSVCQSKNNLQEYYTPDNGYAFSATDKLLEKIKNLQVSPIAAKVPAACGE